MFIFLGLIVSVMTFYEDEYEDGDCDWSFDSFGCYELDNNNECVQDSCLYGMYWLDGPDYCYYCIDLDAMLCDEYGVTISCWDGFYLDGTSCNPCSDFFGEYCLLCDRDDECTLCESDSALFNGRCFHCDDAAYSGYDLNAATCTFDVEDEITVTSCEGHYGLTNWDDGSHVNYWCLDCTSGSYTGFDSAASECEVDEYGVVTVTECEAGYCLWDDYGSSQCHFVGSPVVDCTYYGGKYYATECIPGYSASSQCFDEYGNMGCYDCGGSYYSTIKSCTFSDDECEIVDTYDCKNEDGIYSADNGEGDCVPCDTRCVSCDFVDGSAFCSECKDTELWENGYYDTYDGQCEQCGIYCSECVDYHECTKCMTMVGLEECYEQPDVEDCEEPEDEYDDTSTVPAATVIGIVFGGIASLFLIFFTLLIPCVLLLCVLGILILFLCVFVIILLGGIIFYVARLQKSNKVENIRRHRMSAYETKKEKKESSSSSQSSLASTSTSPTSSSVDEVEESSSSSTSSEKEETIKNIYGEEEEEVQKTTADGEKWLKEESSSSSEEDSYQDHKMLQPISYGL